ncbi:hypothetical protein [Butyrivibrio sp. AE2032]|uniref:hypothetical protein n=1 Tax=Butyrivibrio sp. AE2032 TaxID=1458463 RepID=UPI0005579A1F|nr:hypothetical protein [Butyrivibrio sp. AE2032]
MLNLMYVGIAFSLVFYVVFGVAIRFMELTDKTRNNARLLILVTSMMIFAISGAIAGVLNLKLGLYVLGISLIVLSLVAILFVLSILVELHQIKFRVRMRRFMVLFDVVDKFRTEGKSHEEIMSYLTNIQKLSFKEASDFMEFISDPTNYQFLADVNAKIQEAKVLKKAETDYFM